MAKSKPEKIMLSLEIEGVSEAIIKIIAEKMTDSNRLVSNKYAIAKCST